MKADGACRINALKAAGEQSGEVAGRQSLMTTYTCICRYPPGSAWERQRALRASSLTALFCFSLSRGAVFSSSLSILRLRFEEERATGNKAISIVYGVVDYSSMRSRFATAVGTLEPEEGRGAQAGQPKVELFRNTGLQAFNIYRTPRRWVSSSNREKIPTIAREAQSVAPIYAAKLGSCMFGYRGQARVYVRTRLRTQQE